MEKKYEVLQQILDRECADKELYKTFEDFDRLEIGNFIVFLKNVDPDTFQVQLIDNCEIIRESDVYSEKFSALKKCIEYVSYALKECGYKDVADWREHQNSLQYSINKQITFKQEEPIIDLTFEDNHKMILTICFPKPNALRYFSNEKILETLGLNRLFNPEVRKFHVNPTMFSNLISGMPEHETLPAIRITGNFELSDEVTYFVQHNSLVETAMNWNFKSADWEILKSVFNLRKAIDAFVDDALNFKNPGVGNFLGKLEAELKHMKAIKPLA